MPAGSLTLWRWHARSCPHRGKGRRWTRCNCGIWVQGSLGGEWIKRSLNTRDLERKPQGSVHGWRASREVGLVRVDVPTIEQAVARYFEDATARHLAATTIRKRRELVEGKLLAFCTAKGFHLLKHLDVNALRTFRNGWHYSALSAVKRLEYLRGFLRFCMDSGWIESNPAMVLKAPKVTQRPTLPFDDAEIDQDLERRGSPCRLGHVRPEGSRDGAIAPLLRPSHAGRRVSRTCAHQERQAVPVHAKNRNASVLSASAGGY